MIKYIALLRGINVGGQKKIPMAELRALLTNVGLENVHTYIQSGNVIFQSSETDTSKLALKIQDTITSHFEFEVPVLVLKPEALQQIVDECPFPKQQKENSHFIMLYAAPENNLVDEVARLSYPNEVFLITNYCVYFHSFNGYGKTKFSNNFFERKLKVTATARNYKTMIKLLSLSAE